MNPREYLEALHYHYLVIGQFFWVKYLRRQSEAGTLAVAKQMRKQGIPLEMSLLILCGKGANHA